MTTLFIYALCLLLIQTPVLPSSRYRIWSGRPRLETSSSYDSLEILPYTSTRFGDRTTALNEELVDQDTLLSLLTNTKREIRSKTEEPTKPVIAEIRKLQKVKDAEAFLSEMLRVLHSLFTKKANAANAKAGKHNHDGNIAWSYYDDLGK